MTEAQQVVWIVTEVETNETIEVRRGERGSDDIGGGFGQQIRERLTTLVRKPVAVPREILKRQMSGLLQVVTDLFNQTQTQQQLEMVLDEVELSIEVSSEGQISIVGSGGKLGEKGAIKLKFKTSAISDELK